MDQEPLDQRLSRISTVWTVLRQAHAGAGDAAAAQELLVQRYGGAIRRYLLAALRDPDAADELTQEFALCLVRGEFRRVAPERGRFRDYVKAVLFHMVGRHRKRQQADRARPVPPDGPELANLAAPPEDADREFRASWREELLARAWEALAEEQPVFYEVLRLRAADPDAPSPRLAEELTHRLGKPLTADGVRQTLHRARARFADLLVDEVARSLDAPTIDEVEDELRELNLLPYCQPALQKRNPAP